VIDTGDEARFLDRDLGQQAARVAVGPGLRVERFFEVVERCADVGEPPKRTVGSGFRERGFEVVKGAERTVAVGPRP
jgi:hypothetical protein